MIGGPWAERGLVEQMSVALGSSNPAAEYDLKGLMYLRL